MSKDEKISILLELQVIAKTMKQITKEMMLVTPTPANVGNITKISELMIELIANSQSLMDTVLSTK